MYEELIGKLESATEPDRELDCEIAIAVLGGEIEWKMANYTMDSYPVRLFDSSAHIRGRTEEPVMRYTESVDNAMSLIPAGYDYGLSYSKKYGLEAWVQKPYYEGRCHQGYAPEGVDNDSTRAIALCIAAIRARADV